MAQRQRPGGGQRQGLPRALTQPVSKHAESVFADWCIKYDWTAWQGPQKFGQKSADIQGAASVGGFRLAAHTALKLVMQPLVDSDQVQQVDQAACDELSAIFDTVQQALEKEQAERDERKKAGEVKQQTSELVGLQATLRKILAQYYIDETDPESEELVRAQMERLARITTIEERTLFLRVLASLEPDKQAQQTTLTELADAMSRHADTDTGNSECLMWLIEQGHIAEEQDNA